MTDDRKTLPVRGRVNIYDEDGNPTGYSLYFDSNALADYEDLTGRNLLVDWGQMITAEGLPYSTVRASVYAAYQDSATGQRLRDLRAAGDLIDRLGMPQVQEACFVGVQALMARMGVLNEYGELKATDGAAGKAQPATGQTAPASESSTHAPGS